MAVGTTFFVDSSHGSNRVTRRYYSGHMFFVNRVPVKWLSCRQKTVETSAFSSEFIVMKHCIEDIKYLRFKLRMFESMRIPVSSILRRSTYGYFWNLRTHMTHNLHAKFTRYVHNLHAQFTRTIYAINFSLARKF